MNIIIGNFGNESIALIEWAKQQQLNNVYCLYVNTSWASPTWHLRVEQAASRVKSIGFSPVMLTPNVSFSELVKEQKTFPKPRFSSCVSLLKAATLLKWIEQHDPGNEATILLAKRRLAAKAFANIQERITHSEHYNTRSVWHPLYKHSLGERDELIRQAGFDCLPHQSHECFPCIYCPKQIMQLDTKRIEQINAIENAIEQPLFDYNEYDASNLAQAKKNMLKQGTTAAPELNEALASSCGSPYGCGL